MQMMSAFRSRVLVSILVLLLLLYFLREPVLYVGLASVSTVGFVCIFLIVTAWRYFGGISPVVQYELLLVVVFWISWYIGFSVGSYWSVPCYVLETGEWIGCAVHGLDTGVKFTGIPFRNSVFAYLLRAVYNVGIPLFVTYFAFRGGFDAGG